MSHVEPVHEHIDARIGRQPPGQGPIVCGRPSDPHQAARRSVYVFVKRTLLVPELEVLDFPSTEETCEQRVVSTVAPQALTFLNGEFIHEQSLALAARLPQDNVATAASVLLAIQGFRIGLATTRDTYLDGESIQDFELPAGEPPERALIDGYGATAGDEVVEVRPAARPGELSSRRWRIPCCAVAPSA